MKIWQKNVGVCDKSIKSVNVRGVTIVANLTFWKKEVY